MGFVDLGRGLGKNNFRLKENLRLKRKDTRFPTPHGHPEQLEAEILQKHERIEKALKRKLFRKKIGIIMAATITLLILYFLWLKNL